MRTMKTIFAVAGLIFLTSCSFSQNTNTKETNEVSLSAIEDVFKNAEETMSKERSCFTLPKNIDMTVPQKVYKLTLGYDNTSQDVEVLKQTAETLAHDFFGDDFDNSKSIVTDNFRYDYENGNNYLFYDMFGSFSAIKDQDEYCDPTEITSYEYFYCGRDDISKEYSIGDKKSTVDKACEFAEKYINKGFEKIRHGFVLYPYSAGVYDNPKTGQKEIQVTLAFKYEDVSIDMNDSDLFYTDDKTFSYYLNPCCTITMTSPETVSAVRSNLNYELKSKQELEEIISFSEAVDILERELAANAYFEFVDCKLLYCHRKQQIQQDKPMSADEIVIDTTEKFEFTPTWCFYIDIVNQTNKQEMIYKMTAKTIRVDALTGEITIAFN